MRVGVVRGERGNCVAFHSNQGWIDFTRAYRVYQLVEQNLLGVPVTDLGELLESGLVERDFFERILEFLEKRNLTATYSLGANVQFALPHRPRKILCLGRNYAAHAAETGHDVPKEPLFFSKAPSACIADGDPIKVRRAYGRVDHEGELAIVIGKRCKDLRPELAEAHIAGYTLLNDVTARDMQKRDIEAGHPWLRSKGLDTFCPLGPYIILRSALPLPMEVDIEVRVNGAVRQRSNTRKFIYRISDVLAYISQFMTLEPGDIVSTGTPNGIAPLIPGDVVEVTVTEIGTLRNPVVLDDPA
jgi:2-keto-4-pentenoate hydratase/2-oxohepta-3-ene-1,7-dioic acid hydratase in catechol pathway